MPADNQGHFEAKMRFLAEIVYKLLYLIVVADKGQIGFGQIRMEERIEASAPKEVKQTEHKEKNQKIRFGGDADTRIDIEKSGCQKNRDKNRTQGLFKKPLVVDRQIEIVQVAYIEDDNPDGKNK
jgi:hypothetical protein